MSRRKFLSDDLIYSGGTSLAVRIVRDIAEKRGMAQAEAFIDRNMPEKIKARDDAKEPAVLLDENEVDVVRPILITPSRRDFLRVGGMTLAVAGLIGCLSALNAAGERRGNKPADKRARHIYQYIAAGGAGVGAAGLVLNQWGINAEQAIRSASPELKDAEPEVNAFLLALEPKLQAIRAQARDGSSTPPLR